MAFNDPDPMRNAFLQSPSPWQCMGLGSGLDMAQQSDYQRRMAQSDRLRGFPPMASALDEGSDRDPPRRLEWQEESPSKLWRAWDWTVRAFALFGVYSLVRVFL